MFVFLVMWELGFCVFLYFVYESILYLCDIVWMLFLLICGDWNNVFWLIKKNEINLIFYIDNFFGGIVVFFFFKVILDILNCF